jgi:hypothetical protein
MTAENNKLHLIEKKVMEKIEALQDIQDDKKKKT